MIRIRIPVGVAYGSDVPFWQRFLLTILVTKLRQCLPLNFNWWQWGLERVRLTSIFGFLHRTLTTALLHRQASSIHRPAVLYEQHNDSKPRTGSEPAQSVWVGHLASLISNKISFFRGSTDILGLKEKFAMEKVNAYFWFGVETHILADF